MKLQDFQEDMEAHRAEDMEAHQAEVEDIQARQAWEATEEAPVEAQADMEDGKHLPAQATDGKRSQQAAAQHLLHSNTKLQSQFLNLPHSFRVFSASALFC